MRIDKIKVKNAFNSSVETYAANNSLQNKTGTNLINFIKNYKDNFTNILDIGCGVGNITNLLSKEIINTSILGIDISSNSIARAQSKYNIKFLVNDFDNIKTKTDLIFSNLSLHWSPNLKSTLENMKGSLKKGGMLGFTIPVKNTFHELNDFCNIHKFYESRDLEEMLFQAGYRNVYSKNSSITIKFNTFKDALMSLKNTGTNYTPKTSKGLSLKLKSLLKSNKPIDLTYNISYFLVEV